MTNEYLAKLKEHHKTKLVILDTIDDLQLEKHHLDSVEVVYFKAESRNVITTDPNLVASLTGLYRDHLQKEIEDLEAKYRDREGETWEITQK